MTDTQNPTVETIRDGVKEYYGETLQSTEDLKTSACCPLGTMPSHLQPFLKNIHDDVTSRFYGCGSPIPYALEGCTVLDLGCGTGRDCYLLSQMVGENGRVIGVDMTEEQLAVAKETQEWHREKFGYAKSNVEFYQGYIEDLKSLGIADNSVDVVISNCVINLSANKKEVFKEIFRVLKPGGELYFSDVFIDRRLNDTLANDPIMVGECLGGAFYTEDFRRMLSDYGINDGRLMHQAPIVMTNTELEKQCKGINFYSYTVRAFKLDLEDRCEDYQQELTYQGGMEGCTDSFELDDDHHFEVNKAVPVCGNTADMITQSRYARFFTVSERKEHKGLFDCSSEVSGCCSPQSDAQKENTPAKASSGCC